MIIWKLTNSDTHTHTHTHAHTQWNDLTHWHLQLLSEVYSVDSLTLVQKQT